MIKTTTTGRLKYEREGGNSVSECTSCYAKPLSAVFMDQLKQVL